MKEIRTSGTDLIMEAPAHNRGFESEDRYTATPTIEDACFCYRRHSAQL